MDSGWYRCVLRQPLLKLPKGQVVAVAKSKLTHATITQTYWIMSIEYGLIYQVEGVLFGRNLNQLLTVQRPVKDANLCNRSATSLLTTGQYGTERRNEIRKLLNRSKRR